MYTESADVSKDTAVNAHDTQVNGGVGIGNVTSTLQSLPDSSIVTNVRAPKQNDTLRLLSELLGKNMTMNGIADLKELLRFTGSAHHSNIPSIPVNDLRGEEASLYSRAECILRRSLAALYRLIDIRGWTHSIYNHISARSPDNPKNFLINPFGLLYHEMQASSMVKINEEGAVVQQGSTVLGVNKAGWTLHAALHSVRPDVNCIVHVHLPDVIAVSCIRAGLLPVNAEANELLISHGVRYHDYCGILVDAGEQASIQTDLGETAKILFLRNHGVAIAAGSVAEAWYLTRRVVSACQTQMRMLQLAGGASVLNDLKDAAAQLTDHSLAAASKPPRPFADLDDGQEEVEHEPVENEPPLMNGKSCSVNKHTSWSPSELEFEAEMRVLDSAGFRTGHVYRQPNLLRHAHAHVESMWVGDMSGDQATGADLLTTDFSATEFSAVDDITAAESAGAQQVARIGDSVKVNRLKGAQRNQWLNDKPNGPGLMTSSMIASPHSVQSAEFTPVRPTQQNFSHSQHQPSSPLFGGRGSGDPQESYAAPTPTTRLVNGRQQSDPDKPRSAARLNKSATLPANAHRSLLTPHTTNTLPVDDSGALSADEEKPKPEKKVRKIGSFRMPSFSRKKKSPANA